jgi:hypothetical protein
MIGPTGDLQYVNDWATYATTGRQLHYKSIVATGSPTNATNTYADIDSTNLKLDFASASIFTGRVLCFGHLWATNSGGSSGGFDWIVDSTTRVGATNGAYRIDSAVVVISPVTVIALFTGLSAASHTFKLQFKNGGAGTITANLGTNPQTLIGVEI